MSKERNAPLPAMVVLMLMAVAVSTTNALQVVDPCDSYHWKVTQRAVTVWVADLMRVDKNTTSPAETVIHECDTDGDATLGRLEFISCLTRDLKSKGISPGCYALLLGAAGGKEDGSMDVQDLTRWVRLVTSERRSRGIRKNDNSKKRLKRDPAFENSPNLRQDVQYSISGP